MIGLRSAHSTGTNIGIAGDRPPARSLREWCWIASPANTSLLGRRDTPLMGEAADWSRYDRDGNTIARIALDSGLYYLRTPATRPRMVWADLASAQRGAISMALAALPLDAATARRVAQPNADTTPYLPRPDHGAGVSTSRWVPSGGGDDIPELPEFLRRAARVAATAKNGSTAGAVRP
jgi:hypothetical protein